VRHFDATFEVEGLAFPPTSMYRSIGNECITTLPLEVFSQRNFVAGFIQLKLTFIPKKVRFLSHPLGDLEVTYALHLKLVGKPVYDFLFVIIMIALCNRADHYILALSFLSFFFFFAGLISAVGDWMPTILPHMVWP